jgi:hypothetical protein
MPSPTHTGRRCPVDEEDALVSQPQISVVLVTDHFRTIRRVVARLREQTVRDVVELVIAAPSRAALELDEGAVEGFAAVRVVETGSVHPMSTGRAAGVRAATAPVLFLGETHSFAHPEFAESLIRAHREPGAVVVPGIGNANPESALSWAGFFMDYGPWAYILPAGDIGWGPTWNVAYKREALLQFDESLETMLCAGDALTSAFLARGHQYRLEPAARLDHANVSQAGSWITERYLTGLLIASNRKARWSMARRLLYIAASPLIPAVVLSRMARPVWMLVRAGTLPRGTIGALLLGAVIRTAGEVVGYAVGAAADAEPRMEAYELHKLRYTVPVRDARTALPA